jgi:hypothetical protein
MVAVLARLGHSADEVGDYLRQLPGFSGERLFVIHTTRSGETTKDARCCTAGIGFCDGGLARHQEEATDLPSELDGSRQEALPDKHPCRRLLAGMPGGH